MQAIVVTEHGGPDVLAAGERELPEPAPGEVLVRVLAAGVGPWDAGLRRGSFPGDLPFVPGAEFAGIVVGNTGDDAAFEDGEPVYGYPGLTGCYAEYVTCPSEQMAPIPAGLRAVEAAAVPVDGVTARQGLVDHLKVGSGDTVLITGASGGLGHLAVQIARGLGANVIATTSPRHHDFVHTLGASVVVDHLQPDWPERVRADVPGGVTRVLACAEPTLNAAVRACADGAIVATPVHADAYPDDGRVRLIRYNGESRGSDLIALAPWFDEGVVSVHVSRAFYWRDAATAHSELEAGHVAGKLVLVVDEDLAAQTRL
jgi:NADPH:quinone reductase-like Zn-dependent oxidoreductase